MTTPCSASYDGFSMECYMQYLDMALSTISTLDGPTWERGSDAFNVKTDCNVSELLDLNHDQLTRERIGTGYISTKGDRKFTRFIYLIAPAEDYAKDRCLSEDTSAESSSIRYCVNHHDGIDPLRSPLVIEVSGYYVFILGFDGLPLRFNKDRFLNNENDENYDCNTLDVNTCRDAAMNCGFFGTNELAIGNYSEDLAGEPDGHEIILSADHRSSKAVYEEGGGCGGRYFDGYRVEGLSVYMILDSSNLFPKEFEMVRYSIQTVD